MNVINLDRKTIRILVVDDRKLIRQSLKIGLEPEEGIEIVGEAEDGNTALEQIAKLHPDLAIIDLEMPGMNGIEAIEIIRDRFRATKTLVFSSHEERKYIHRAIVAGANGYLLKGTPMKDLAKAIRNIERGYFQLGSELLGQLSLNSQHKASDLEKKALKITKQSRQEISNIEIDLNQKVSKSIDIATEAIRDELIEILGKKLQELRRKQKESNAKIRTIQKLFYLAIASQIVLFGLALYF